MAPRPLDEAPVTPPLVLVENWGQEVRERLWPHSCFAIPDPRPQGYSSNSGANPGSANSNASRTAGSVRRIHSRA